MRDWADPKELQKFWIKLILDIYIEFVRNQREQSKWEAGMEVMNKIGE